MIKLGGITECSPIMLQFDMKDADLYSLRFRE